MYGDDAEPKKPNPSGVKMIASCFGFSLIWVTPAPENPMRESNTSNMNPGRPILLRLFLGLRSPLRGSLYPGSLSRGSLPLGGLLRGSASLRSSRGSLPLFSVLKLFLIFKVDF